MKKLFMFICVLMAMAFTAQVVLAEPVFRRQEFKEKVTLEKDVVVKDTLNFAPDAEITSDSRGVYPQNFISNSLFGVWSGGTRYGSGGVAAVPEGWKINGVYTGVTRIDTVDVVPGSGSSIYGGYPHSVFVSNFHASPAAGVTSYLSYPGDITGVSTSLPWYGQFRGQRVVFGAFVKKDNEAAVANGVTQNFIRPYINTSSSANAYTVGNQFTYGNYITKGGWNLVTAVTTVPLTATALDVGFSMNPTTLASKRSGKGTEWNFSNSGDTAFICAPFLLINPLKAEYVYNPNEEIDLNTPLVPWAGNTTFGAMGADAAGNTFDLSSANGWKGVIPDSAKSIYVMMDANIPNGGVLCVYGDAGKGGITFYGSTALSGASQIPVWLPLSKDGTITFDNVQAVTGVSVQVNKIKMRK